MASPAARRDEAYQPLDPRPRRSAARQPGPAIRVSFFSRSSTAFLPRLYARAPRIVQTLFTDPLPTATIVSVLLNQLLGLDAVSRKLRRKGSAAKHT